MKKGRENVCEQVTTGSRKRNMLGYHIGHTPLNEPIGTRRKRGKTSVSKSS